ncbi:glycerol-3-phosphate dehydrogenase [Sphingomonas paucimobilis]|nr:glycerol-3-phosphate dehydrogenase [Sphingomonas paucimobilis]
MTYDIAIIGAGMAGASLAAAIGARARVVLIEAEDLPPPCYGTVGGLLVGTYGGPAVQPLTTASGPTLRDGGYLTPLGSLHIGRREDAARIDRLLADFAGSGVELLRVRSRHPRARPAPEWVYGISEPSCAYIDVAALHADYLAAAKAAGAVLITDAALLMADRHDGLWRLETKAGPIRARVLVNAAGAWADIVARIAGAAPVGITPYRRTMMQLRTDPPAPAGLPHVIDINAISISSPRQGGGYG